MKSVVITIVSPGECTQNATLQEPLEEGFELKNALAYFGFQESDVDWFHKSDHTFMNQSNTSVLCGIIKGTTRIVNVVIS